MLYKSNIIVGSNASCRFFVGSAIHSCHFSLWLRLSDSIFSVSLTPVPHCLPPVSCSQSLNGKKKKKQESSTKASSHVSPLHLSFSFSSCVPLSAQFPEPRESGLGETGGLSEDHSACLGASPWALVGGLASALLLAQHAL